MSLTTFLKNKDVQKRFNQEFEMPRVVLSNELQAPPLTHNFSLMGTAFDYLMRFYIERINPIAHTRRWIPEAIPENPFFYLPIEGGVLPNSLEHQLLQYNLYLQTGKWFKIDAKTGLPLSVAVTASTTLLQQVTAIIAQAKRSHTAYLNTGTISDELIADVIRLAQLDAIVRARYVDPNIGIVDDRDIVDQRSLLATLSRFIEGAPSFSLKADTICEINPEFKASALVGGADADLIIDRTLIEIKTTKHPVLQREHFNQLMGYYVLSASGGDYTIDTIALYYSRFGEMYSLPVDDVINQETFPSFVNWFEKRAEEERRIRRDKRAGIKT